MHCGGGRYTKSKKGGNEFNLGLSEGNMSGVISQAQIEETRDWGKVEKPRDWGKVEKPDSRIINLGGF